MTNGIIEIVILAMIAAFLGMRLYSVLGERAEEEDSIPHQRDNQGRDNQIEPSGDPQEGRAREGKNASPQLVTPAAAPAMRKAIDPAVPATERGIRAIAAADSRFDLISFLEGAKGAYAMVLEAFWKGDRETLQELCDDDVYASFAAAIDAREAAKETLDNRLVRIEETQVRRAEMDGNIARIAVSFVADIAGVTRDKKGNVVAGSLNDAIESRDVWTFMRDVKSGDANWLLDETDEG